MNPITIQITAITYSSYITLNLSQFQQLYLYSDGYMNKGFKLSSFHQLQGNLFHDFSNCVFRVLPVMNYRTQSQLIEELVQEKFDLEGNLQTRKQLIQSMNLNLDGEMNSNISLYNKLKGTPLLLTSSNFHLVHVASLKFLSLNDDSLENLTFDLIDFPNDKCILKFNPCLNFQKLRTNVVYNGDVVVLSTTKLVVNRYPNLYCNYVGDHYEEFIREEEAGQHKFLSEMKKSRIFASVDDQSRWCVNVYCVGTTGSEKEKDEYLFVGDVFALHLSEKNVPLYFIFNNQMFLNTIRSYDPFEKILQILSYEERQQRNIYPNNQQPNNFKRFSTQQNQLLALQFSQKLLSLDYEKQNQTNREEPISQKKSLYSSVHKLDQISEDQQMSPGRLFESRQLEGSSQILKQKQQVQETQQAQDKSIIRIPQNNNDLTLLKKILIVDLEVQFEDITENSNQIQVGGSRKIIQLPTTCFWKIEDEKFNQGGKAQFMKVYRIRHFQTGRYLEVYQRNNQTGVKLTEHVTKQSLFQFQPQTSNTIKSNDHYIRKDSFYYLKHVQSGVYLGVQSFEQPKKNENQDNKRQSPTLSTDQSFLNTFKMRKADIEDIQEIKFLLFSLPLAMETIVYAGKMKGKKIQAFQLNVDDVKERIRFYNLFESVSNMLYLFESYINNRMLCNIQRTQAYSQTSPIRQDVIREQNILALLCWMLFRLFPEKEDFEFAKYQNITSIFFELGTDREFMIQIESNIQGNQLNINLKQLEKLQDHHIKRQILLSYKLYITLKEICKQKSENQNSLGKFIHILQNHMGSGDFVTECLQSTFHNNREFMKKLTKLTKQGLGNNSAVKDVPIENTESKCLLGEVILKLRQFEPFTRSDILGFLQSTCSINNEAIYSNQEMIYKILVEDKKLRQQVLINITNDTKQLFLDYYDQNGELVHGSLEEFLRNSSQEDSSLVFKQFMFLKAQLKLYAQLCLNRNFNACKTFADMFPVQALIKYMFNQQLDEEVKADLFLLMRNIYIDREPNTIQVKPNLVRVIYITERKDNMKKDSKHHQQNYAMQGEMYNKLFLYDEDEDYNINSNMQDENELRAFLQGFKVDLVAYLQRKCEELIRNFPPYKIYNSLTLEIIKVLYMILQFGLFQQKEDHSNKIHKAANLSTLFDKKVETKGKETEIERLITHLAQIFEYDSSYFQALHTQYIQRTFEQQRSQKQNLVVNNLMSNGINNLGKNLTSLFTMSSSNEKQENAAESTFTTNQQFDQDMLTDPLYKKISGLKKIIARFSNKTYTLREDRELDYEVQIKIQICEVFSYLLDMRQDYLIDNTLEYFQQVFIGKVEILSAQQIKKQNFDVDLVQLLPENILQCGEDIANIVPLKQYATYPTLVKSFDQILQRPFVEVVLLALYFAHNTQLQNRIVEILERYVTQKKEFCEHLGKLQLLLSPESQQLYYIWLAMIQKLKNYVQYSQIWLQLDTPSTLNARNEESLERTIEKLWKIESILQRSANEDVETLRTRQSMFLNIGGYVVIQELLDKAFAVVDNHIDIFELGETDDNDEMYKQELAQKITKMFQICFSILALFSKNNQENQELIFKKVVRTLMNYITINLGQVELITDLFRDNYELIGQLQLDDINYFMDLIAQHGRYAEFLEFFDIILCASEQKSHNVELHKLVLATLLNNSYFEYANPFSSHEQDYDDGQSLVQFYQSPPSQEQYKQKFLKILARCVRLDLGLSLITKISQQLKTKDLLLYHYEKAQEMRDPHLNQQLQLELMNVKIDVCQVLVVLVQNTKESLNELCQSSKYFLQIVYIETNWIEKQTHYSLLSIVYLIDTLLLLVNLYNEGFMQDQISTFFESNLDQQKKERKQMYEFAEVLLKSLEKMFFLTPQDILGNITRMISVQRLANTFSIQLPKNIQQNNAYLSQQSNKEIQNEQQGPQSEQYEKEEDGGEQLNTVNQRSFAQLKMQTSDLQIEKHIEKELNEMKDILGGGQSGQIDYSLMVEYWELLKYKVQESTHVCEILKDEASVLSKSIWTVSNMFSAVKSEQKDLVLCNEDLLVKIFEYLQFWQNNLASKGNVIFILNVLINILKDSDDNQELEKRQQLFDKLNSTKIILVLLWDESQVDSDYLLTLMKFTIILIQGGNKQVQNTIYEFFQTSSSCEKFFYKIQQILESQINTTMSHQKLTTKETKIVVRSLRILQLFCEGHNSLLQNYIHYQSNSKISNDLVTLTVKLLSSLKVSDKNFDIVMQCFDTLTESIQGPCKSNQVAIGNSKFLEYAVLILSEDAKIFELQQLKPILNNPTEQIIKETDFSKPTIKQKANVHQIKNNDKQLLQNIQIRRSQLAKLKYKCLITIVSLLEGHDQGDTLILRIIRAIPLSVLTNNITRIYELFHKYCNGDYRIEQFNRAELKGIDDEYSEMIIENGFFIYTLMQLFLSSKKGKDILYEDSEMNYVLNEFQDSKQSDFDKLLEGNILGELTKFGGQLLNQGVGAMKSLKQNIDKALMTPEEVRRQEEQKSKEEQKQLTKNSIKFFKENTCSIEVLRDDQVLLIYFPKLPFCKMLPEDLKQQFHDNVVRTSSKTKLASLMKETHQLVNTMKHEERLRIIFSYNQLLGLFANHGKLWEQCAFISSLLINIIICFSYSQYFLTTTEGDVNYQKDLKYERLYDPRFLYNKAQTETTYFITTCGIVNLVFNSLVVFFFLIKRAPLKVQFIWDPFFQRVGTNLGIIKIVILFIFKFFHSLYILLQDYDILYYSIYILANIIGLIIHPFFFAFHLLDVLKLDQLKTVFKAIWQTRTELGLSLLLLLIMEYYFAIIGYLIFYEDFVNLGEINSSQNCSSFWKCFFTLFDWTFKATGSVGTKMQDSQTVKYEISWLSNSEKQTYFEDEEYNGVDHKFVSNYYKRLFYDNALNIMIVFILLNMIQGRNILQKYYQQGLIVDTFGSFRVKLKEKVDDQQYYCFICGNDREKLDKSGNEKGFFYHIKVSNFCFIVFFKEEHYMWNYVFYNAYLQFKDITELNGNESYVYYKIQSQDISWFPIKRARAIATEQDEEQNLENKLNKLEASIKLISSNVRDVNYRIIRANEYLQL